jgi:hypothetical protein
MSLLFSGADVRLQSTKVRDRPPSSSLIVTRLVTRRESTTIRVLDGSAGELSLGLRHHPPTHQTS